MAKQVIESNCSRIDYCSSYVQCNVFMNDTLYVMEICSFVTYADDNNLSKFYIISLKYASQDMDNTQMSIESYSTYIFLLG